MIRDEDRVLINVDACQIKLDDTLRTASCYGVVVEMEWWGEPRRMLIEAQNEFCAKRMMKQIHRAIQQNCGNGVDVAFTDHLD